MTIILTLSYVDYSVQNSQDYGLLSGLRVMYNSYRHCEDQEDTMLCLKGKALKLVDRAIHSDDISLVDGKDTLYLKLHFIRIKNYINSYKI